MVAGRLSQLQGYLPPREFHDWSSRLFSPQAIPMMAKNKSQTNVGKCEAAQTLVGHLANEADQNPLGFETPGAGEYDSSPTKTCWDSRSRESRLYGGGEVSPFHSFLKLP